MIQFLIYYLIFCAATSVTFQLICLNPVHKIIAEQFPEDVCNTYKKMTLTITLIGGMICAPLFFMILLSNKSCAGFKEKYYNIVKQDINENNLL